MTTAHPYNQLMRTAVATALVLLCAGCVDPKVPNYTLTPPTTPSPPIPTPIPPPTSPLSPLSVTLYLGPSRPVAGNETAFNAAVTPLPTAPTTYTWNFGDGNTRQTASSPTMYTVGRAGSYDASVVVLDGSGRSATGTAHYIVDSPPTPPPDPPPPPPAPPPSLSAILNCTAGNATTMLTSCNVQLSFGGAPLGSSTVTSATWDWGDGPTTSSTTAATTHQYTQPGKFIVLVRVTATTPNGAQTVTAFVPITIS